MNLIRSIRSWFISRRHKNWTKDNPHQMYWGTVKVGKDGDSYLDETCSFGPWTIGNEMIDITGNKDLEPAPKKSPD